MSNIPETVLSAADSYSDHFDGEYTISHEGRNDDCDLYLANNPKIGGASILFIVKDNKIKDTKFGIDVFLYFSTISK